MPAPKGNKYGGGKKGRSGRKSAYEEEMKAQMLNEAWFGKGVKLEEVDEIMKKMKNKKGVIKLMQLFLARSIVNSRGTELQAMFNKLFPDKIEQKSEVTVTEKLSDHTQKLLEKYKNDDDKL